MRESQHADEKQLTDPTQHRVSDLSFALRPTSSHIISISRLFHLLAANYLSPHPPTQLSLSCMLYWGKRRMYQNSRASSPHLGILLSPHAVFSPPPPPPPMDSDESPPPLKWWQVKCNILSQVWVRRESQSLWGISNMYVRWLPSKKEKDEERGKEKKKIRIAAQLSLETGLEVITWELIKNFPL